jgi:hypothetical protein
MMMTSPFNDLTTLTNLAALKTGMDPAFTALKWIGCDRERNKGAHGDHPL